MKLEIVEINGKFALKKTTCGLFHSYYDLKTRGFWWEKYSIFFSDCLGTQEQVEAVYKDRLAKRKERVIRTLEYNVRLTFWTFAFLGYCTGVLMITLVTVLTN